MRSITIKNLISKFRSNEEAVIYSKYILSKPEILGEAAKELMQHIPPNFGACAMLSAAWAGILTDQYSIPAIVVAGDLKINNNFIFKCSENLPSGISTGTVILKEWSGHCWIEVGGFIGDLSIFRTAYAITGPSVLKDYVNSYFGKGRGALLFNTDNPPSGMNYIPKYVLDDNQIEGLINGLMHQLKGI